MKFYYDRDSLELIHNFSFSLTENEIRKVYHKNGTSYDTVEIFLDPLPSESYKIWKFIRLIQDSLDNDMDKVNLDFNYKKKYEELVELLKPHKLEDDMSPSTTLKMILKYQVK
jgi:hypothetical protein